jgi:hypothetical protein
MEKYISTYILIIMPIFSIIFVQTYSRGPTSNYELSRQGDEDVDWAYN